jgi:hypothetical protein
MTSSCHVAPCPQAGILGSLVVEAAFHSLNAGLDSATASDAATERLNSMNQPCFFAPVAQLDRALASEARGREFESPRARQFHMGLRPLTKDGEDHIFRTILRY